jgi:hypothetical protein
MGGEGWKKLFVSCVKIFKRITTNEHKRLRGRGSAFLTDRPHRLSTVAIGRSVGNIRWDVLLMQGKGTRSFYKTCKCPVKMKKGPLMDPFLNQLPAI